MTDRLETAIRSLWNIDQALNPAPYAAARERAIVDGLHALAAAYGKEIEFTFIDARGELAFNIMGAAAGMGGEYGEDLAAVLSLVPRRIGLSPTSSPVLAQNNWCRMGHFDAERLLKVVGADFYEIHGPDTPDPGSDDLEEDGIDEGESFQTRP